jgi:hypothetical protein
MHQHVEERLANAVGGGTGGEAGRGLEGAALPGAGYDSHGRKRFFLEKEAKPFANERARRGKTDPLKGKVFWFFFPKKNCLPYFFTTAGN